MGVHSNMKELYEHLTQREKKLLYTLICFLIIVGGWFLLITPSLDKRSELNQTYQNSLALNTSKQSDLSKYLLAPDELKIKKNSLKTIIDKYNSQLSNEKIDKLLTTAFLTNGLKPVSLAISDVKPASVKTAATDQSFTDGETSEYVTQATVNVSVSGSLVQITNTIDTLNKMKGIEISKLTYTTTTSSSTQGSVRSATITIVVYMANS